MKNSQKTVEVDKIFAKVMNLPNFACPPRFLAQSELGTLNFHKNLKFTSTTVEHHSYTINYHSAFVHFTAINIKYHLAMDFRL